MQNRMNEKMMFIALLPLSVVVGLLHVYIMIHIGLFSLIFLAMMVYVVSGVLFYIGLATTYDSEMSWRGLPILAFLWAYLIFANSRIADELAAIYLKGYHK